MISEMVSIITPVYNGAKYLGETVEAVLAQTYANWEMIIVDDGSKDHPEEVIKPYLEKDSRIRFLSQENGGSAAARNTGIRRAQGQYLCLLDADDIWHPDFLEKQLAFMKEMHAACVCASYNRIDENSQPIGHTTHAKKVITLKDMEVMNYVACLTGIYDREVCGTHYLDESLKVRDDYAYWYEVIQVAGGAYGNPEVLADYRVFANSTTGNKRKLIKKQYRFYRDYLKLSVPKSACNVLRWGVRGLFIFR